MTPRLRDLTLAFESRLQQEIQNTPSRQRSVVEHLTQLEHADYTDQLRACATDQEREVLSRRWLRAFNPQ